MHILHAQKTGCFEIRQKSPFGNVYQKFTKTKLTFCTKNDNFKQEGMNQARSIQKTIWQHV
jgi:hypothetical protein